MELIKSKLNRGLCPYLKNRQWISSFFQSVELNSTIYQSMLHTGFRRSGNIFYQNQCNPCRRCISIRVLVDDFVLSGSQKRILKKNKDIKVKNSPLSFDMESYLLYKKYQYYRHKNKGDRVGVGWIDILPDLISSVYFAYDPDFHKRSLGTFSILKEIELCKLLHKKWLYLGFWVKDCDKMSYKTNFKPYELLIDEKWSDL